MLNAQARRILRIVLTTANPQTTGPFYTGVLGFRPAPDQGLADLASLRLGEQHLGLARGVGDPYPQPRASNDPWFHHFAIAVSDIDEAYRRLAASRFEPISVGGPQLLPPSTGSVTAYKFRDPEGRPLELSHSPRGAWDKRPQGDVFLGIDHTAIAVRDLDASLAFYTQVLGFAEGPRLLNTGPEQDRLDGLVGVQLDIAILQTALPGPHIELLHYRAPLSQAPPRPIDAGDAAATRIVIEVRDLAAVAQALKQRGATLASVAQELACQDPDGHRLVLTQAPD